MGIIVQRPPADKPGGDIISSVLTTADAQLERGTYEIDESSSDRIILTGSVVRTDHIQPGAMASIDNNGEVSIGVISAYSGSIRFGKEFSIRQQITVETVG